MAIVVEDGNGQPDAISYASAAQADAYLAARGAKDWADRDVGDKEAALVVATDWINRNYGQKWKGNPSFYNQALDWPRVGIVDDRTGALFGPDFMPKELVGATIELAAEAARGTLYNNASPQTPQVVEDTLGPITTKYNPLRPADVTMQRTFPWIDAMLGPLVRGSNMRLRSARG